MAKHKLYRQFETSSPLTSSMCKETSPVKDVHPTTSDTVVFMRCKTTKSKSAEKIVTNEKSTDNEKVSNKNINSIFFEPLPDGDCASDSDFDSNDFFCKSGPKLPYTTQEDEWILRFVLKGQNIFKVGSISLWKHLEAKKENPKRTYQSLKNRFLRNIRPLIFTTYKHVITDEAEVEKILTKFPELKYKIGRTNTLSRIQLPARNEILRSAEKGLANGSGHNDERATPPRTPPSDGVPNGSHRREPILNLHDFSNFHRKVTVRNESLAISVNFMSKTRLDAPLIPCLGIYEKYKKFKKKNKLVLCSACGRYNQPIKSKSEDSVANGESLKFSAESDVLVANSLEADREKSLLTNSGSPSAKRSRAADPEDLPHSPFSPSLLGDAGEGGILRGGSDPPDGPPETDEVGQAPETSNSAPSRQESDPLRGTDLDLDSTYEETVTDFKKLIKNEEERLLVKRCLRGKGEVLGISDSLTQMSMESYFVELSPNLETPELTKDYSDESRTPNSDPDTQSSVLARNMMKMLEENKTNKES